MSVKPYSLLYAVINYQGFGGVKENSLLKGIMSDVALNPQQYASEHVKFGTSCFDIQVMPQGYDEFTKIHLLRDSIVISCRIIDGYHEQEVAFDDVLSVYYAMTTWLELCKERHPVSVSKIQLLTEI